jgi:hypothetical protein
LKPVEELDAPGEEPTLVEHFRHYLETQGARASSAAGVLARFRTLLDALANEEDVRFPEEALLPDASAESAGPEPREPLEPARALTVGVDDPGDGAPPKGTG